MDRRFRYALSIFDMRQGSGADEAAVVGAEQTLDEETQKKLSASTMRIYQSLFDPVTADEVHRELKELLAGKYPEIWKLTEDTVFGKQEAWPKLKEFALKQIAEGRGNPFLPENAGRIFAPSVPAAEETK